MTATSLVAETYAPTDNPNGVCVVDGYGVRVSVDKRHLNILDGIGAHRRTRRYPKVGHNIARLVLVGHSGTITLEALRWLDRVGIMFTHIDTDGTLLTASAHPSIDNARLRRAQALAPTNPAGLAITRAILDTKLAGQARVANTHLQHRSAATRITELRTDLAAATDLAECREAEATAAVAYFAAWSGRVAVAWATKDQPKIPDHWTRYDGRRSPLGKVGGRKAADPINALLNYLYALAEIECRNACLRLGLDPGLGILHTDIPRRDSLALDLIEVIRPDIDAWVIDLADGHTFRRADFHETDDGHCRILAPLTHHLTATLPLWARTVAPWAEHVAHTLSDTTPLNINKATPLTSTNRRTASRSSSAPRRKSTADNPIEDPPKLRAGRSMLGPKCADCGTALSHPQRTYCPDCWPTHRAEAARTGTQRAAARLDSVDKRTERGAAISAGKQAARKKAALAYGWQPHDWNTIAPAVQTMTLAQIQQATGLSITTASRIRTGRSIPHACHWTSLAAEASG